MNQYQVIARKYRPQTFKEVLAQDSTVTTLINAIKKNRLAHAYIFSGSRGTGKTTLARIFAKTLNCKNITKDYLPCNSCQSCIEISASTSLNVLEIDGASNRGIDDIRKINETVSYKTTSGAYKIYIIDEVHMLTKEAFNALLKTLEEPPENVIFIFATTEVNKLLPTILSRCQRFNLNRIPKSIIIEKLKTICQDMKIMIEEEALGLIASHAKGGLRDAESLMDQIISFQEGDQILVESVNEILGAAPKELFFNLDQFGKEGKLEKAFEISHQIFSKGKDLTFFLESLTEHFRNLLAIKLLGDKDQTLSLSNQEREKYLKSAKLYRQDQLLDIVEYLVKFQTTSRMQSINQITIEAILLHIMRTHQRIPIDILVQRLSELEGATAAVIEKPAAPKIVSNNLPPIAKKQEIKPQSILKQIVADKPLTKKVEKPSQPVKSKSEYDTLVQFASVELGGTIQQKNNIQ